MGKRDFIGISITVHFLFALKKIMKEVSFLPEDTGSRVEHPLTPFSILLFLQGMSC